ncbi:hypothetical protein ACJ3XI_01835 [Litorimonas sp. RW-G-Af-16]|uniref:hypothetical protein n=1 Tax=Litorimonas sp. RW-G-Af-16 TaxID=3241168 RepID=UPI00390CB607
MSRVSNTLEGRTKDQASNALVKPMTILALVLIGIFSFAALFVLIGYSDDLRQKETGQATPLSRSAVGYVGLVQLLENMGYDVTKDPKPYKYSWRTRDQLRIYTVPDSNKSSEIEKLDLNKPTLIILPKWNVVPMQDKPGWVRKASYNEYLRASHLQRYIGKAGSGIYLNRISREDFPNTAGPAKKLESFQYFSNSRPFHIERRIDLDEAKSQSDTTDNNDENRNSALDKFIEDLETEDDAAEKSDLDEFFDNLEEDAEKVESPRGYVVIRQEFEHKPYLIQLGATKTYVLSDPDFVNTMGLNTQSQARHAVNIIQGIIERDDLDDMTVTFDLSLHGVSGKPNLIKLMTQAPFLAATLCLLAAGGLVAWQGFARFGDPSRTLPDFSQGPASLAKTSAAFFASSGRLGSMGGAYAQLTRRQVIRKLGLSGQSAAIIDRRLAAREALRNVSPKFADLENISANTDGVSFTDRARALAKWKEEMIREP